MSKGLKTHYTKKVSVPILKLHLKNAIAVPYFHCSVSLRISNRTFFCAKFTIVQNIEDCSFSGSFCSGHYFSRSSCCFYSHCFGCQPSCCSIAVCRFFVDCILDVFF